MRVLVTRPCREAQSWLRALKAAGHDPVALPLIEIATVGSQSKLAQAWQQISAYDAIMFVSANAADYFFAGKPETSNPLFRANGPLTRAWATGPGTGRALARAGASADWIDLPEPDALQFDSESLWCKVAGQISTDARILIVRGQDIDKGDAGSEVLALAAGTGRDWLARRIEEAGGSVDFLVTYLRKIPVFTSLQQDQARLAATDGSLWLFSSSQAVNNLAASFPAQPWAQARAVATHPRIAQTARDVGFGVVSESRPALADVIASIESLG